MGRDRSERQNKSAAEVSLKLHAIFNINHKEAYTFYNHYNELKKYNFKLNEIMAVLQHDFGDKFILYFTALAMEIISKEIIEGINIDKKES